MYELLPSSLRDATSLMEGGFGSAVKFPGKPQSLRVSPEAPSLRELSHEVRLKE